jgi:hypothetical protein
MTSIKEHNARFSRRSTLQAILSGALFVGSAGMIVGETTNLLDRTGTNEDEKPPAAVMFVTKDDAPLSRKQGAAMNSFFVRGWCEQNDVEYRKYHDDSDMFQVRQWVKDMHRVGVRFGAPCLVVIDRDGAGSVYNVPSGKDATLELLRRIFA